MLTLKRGGRINSQLILWRSITLNTKLKTESTKKKTPQTNQKTTTLGWGELRKKITNKQQKKKQT